MSLAATFDYARKAGERKVLCNGDSFMACIDAVIRDAEIRAGMQPKDKSQEDCTKQSCN